MKYDNSFFDQSVDRRNTNCIKWDSLEKTEGAEMLPMWVADMDFRCPAEVTDALVKRARHPVYGYTEQSEAAVKATLDFMRRRHGLELTAEQHTLMPCVVTGLRAAVLALTEPGDKIIVQTPVYAPFYASIEKNGRVIAESPLKADAEGRYTMDLDDIERLCAEGAKLMLLCSPHNPVCRAWTRKELSDLTAILTRYGAALVSDEIHEDFVYEKGGFIPVLSVLEDENAMVASLTSVSKTFNIAGLQQSVMFTRNMRIKARVEEVMTNAGVTSGNIFALTATEAAYRYGDAWLDGVLEYVKQAEGILRKELKARLPKAVVTPLEATYLAWVDFRAYGLTTEELVRRTHLAGVAFTPGTFFGKERGEGFLRINLACPHSLTMEAIERLERAIKDIK